MLREPHLALEKATALEESAVKTKIDAKELKQETEIYNLQNKILRKGK